MDRFLINNRDELVARCTAKVAERPTRAATTGQLANGIPMFLEQLIRTLQAEESGAPERGFDISGGPGGDTAALSEMGVAATAHGKALHALGYTVDQVVHDYGDLCQAITDLAVERDAPFSVDEFRTLNRCLDNAIADAVTEFSGQRDITAAIQQSIDQHEKLASLVHELRNSLQTASLAFDALETGQLPVRGATGSVLKRSLGALEVLMAKALAEFKQTSQAPSSVFSLAYFIAEAKQSALLQAAATGCSLTVTVVDPSLAIKGNRGLLFGALLNLLQNAFKFTHAHTEVTLSAYADDESVSIDVADHCGGLPLGGATSMFQPFTQNNPDKSGLGLGLSIAQRSVEADGGTLQVLDLPGVGCVFRIRLMRHALR